MSWRGFHYADLCNFRQRLIDNQAERLVFEQVLQWVRALGFLRRHGQQRTDSTHVLGCVERMSRLELAWETLRVTLRALKVAAPRWYAAVIPATFDEVYAERQSDWRLNQAEIAAALQRAGQDGFWLLARLSPPAPEAVRTLPEVAVLATVWAQQFEQRADRTLVQTPPIKGKGVVVSPHDPEARWSKKRSTAWVGYKLQVTETAEEDDPEGPDDRGPPPEAGLVHFLTDIEVTAANDGDSEALDEIQRRLLARDLKPEEQTVDQAYVSGPNLARSTARGITLLGPVSTSQGDKANGYRQSDFRVDWATHQSTCPHGQEAVHWQEGIAPEAPTDPSRREIKIFFGAACQGCPGRSLCRPGRQGRTITFNAFHAELAARRAEQQTEEFQARLHRRVGIEGTLFGLVWSHGVRRARYRGQTKVRLQALFIGAAANLKRLARALTARAASRKQAKAAASVSC